MHCVQGIGDVAVTSPSFSDERKTQHLLMSATACPQSSVTRSSQTRRQWRRSSVDTVATTAASLGHRQDDTSPRYKTELCRTFAEHGSCRYGDRCQFAHGRADLRAVARHPKYKTDLCRTYHTTGLCPYGPRCHFIHNDDDELRRQRPTAPQPRAVDVDSAARELELRLALLSLRQRQTFDSRSATSSHFYVDRSVGVTAAPPAAPQWPHVPQDYRQSAAQSSTPPTALIGSLSPPVAGALDHGPRCALDSVGNSTSSSAADDDSPPPLSPTPGPAAADDSRRQLVDMAASNERLTALLILAARLRLLQGTTHVH